MGVLVAVFGPVSFFFLKKNPFTPTPVCVILINPDIYYWTRPSNVCKCVQMC